MNHRTARAAPLLLGVWALAAAPCFALAPRASASIAQAQDVNAEFDALVERFDAAQEAFESEMNKLYQSFDDEKATEDEKTAFTAKQRELMSKDPARTFTKDFAALAESAKGTDTAAKALIKVVELDRANPGFSETAGSKALATLLADHIKSPLIAKLPGALARARSVDAEARKSAFKKLKSDCPLDEVKASAMYSLANLMLNDNSDGPPSAETRQLFVDLKQQFGTLTASRGKTYGTLADAVLFEFDHLQLGMHAPDFEVVDETGAKFKLSDYKGKVVVVDFWGNW